MPPDSLAGSLALSLSVIAMAAALAGCSASVPSSSAPSQGSPASSQGSTPSSQGSAASSESTAAASAVPGSGTHAGGVIDVCRAVPLSAVAAATGRGYTSTASTTSRLSGAPVYSCRYNDGDVAQDTDEILLYISVFRGADPREIFTYEATEVAGTNDMQPVDGLGDSAQTDENELDVAWGSDVVAITDALRPGTMSPLTRDAFEALARQVHQAL